MGRTVHDPESSMQGREDGADRDTIKVYLVGGGIASLAAAAFLIRDGDVPGHNITVLEELDRLGGSLDGSGSATDGYVIRGGRMFESKYLCTFDLFSSIPTLDATKTVTQEIVEFNETIKTSSKSRLFRGGHRLDAPQFGLGERHILSLERVAVEPEGMLGKSSHRRPVRPLILRDRFLVHVVHDLRLPALAQRRGVQTLSAPVCPHGSRVQQARGDHAHGLQPVRLAGPAAPEVAWRARRAVRVEHARHRPRLGRGRGQDPRGAYRLPAPRPCRARSR